MTETMTTEAQLTKAQFEVCRALAARHDHAWAMGDITCPEEGISLEEIAQHTKKHPTSKWYGGVQAPTVNKGVVQHTTASGRMSWHVWPDGAFEIVVSRPKVGEVISYTSGMNTSVLPHARVRHAAPLIDCLNALGFPIPAKLTSIRDVGGAEILRRLSRLETLPRDLSQALEDVWTTHKEGPDYQPTSAEIEQRAARLAAEYDVDTDTATETWSMM